ncbi:nuclear transport factor 2 family protein [Streptomyces sp. NPDC046988]|uniref:nuclear transport factor 2 family protein n=1 Tax=Streptomyces sp. NPDC046988 TaxID=3154922 RepID=UPI00340E4B5D
MSTPPCPHGDSLPSHRLIENLIARYAELVDDGDFAGLGALLADATFRGSGEPVSGNAAIEEMFRNMLIVHADGTPRTQHVTTNINVEVDEQAGTAFARSYVTVLQALADLPLQPVAAGRYRDRFARRDGQWRFVERSVQIRMVGDVSRHLHGAAAGR